MRVWRIFLILATATVVIAEFTETPMMPVNVTLNEDVVFRCSHTNALTYAWYINESAIGNNPPADITPSFNTLTIIALPRNNNTVIQCVAIIHNGTLLEEGSPPVILIIPDTCGSRMVSTAVRSFIEVPLSQTVAEGVEVRFRCRHRATNTLVWEVDGVLFNQSSTLNASTFAVPVDGGMARHVLLFDAILTYHHTSIVCAAIFSNGCPQQRTMPALLLIQGPLKAISGVFRDNLANQVGISYLWEPPSTLELTGVEPDVVFCVKVCNITCGADNLVASDCEVMDPVYPSSLGGGLDPSYVYEITVTPRSNVLGAINGSAFTKQEVFMSVEVSPRPVEESSAGVMMEFGVSINDTESERLVKARASSYSIEIVSVDGSEIVSESFEESGERVAVLLSKRKRWTYTVFAYGCQLHPVSVTKELISTFAVQNVSVSSGASGELRVTASFLTNTSAVGMLAIVYSTENDLDIHYTEARLPQTEIHLAGLTGSAYSTSVFTIEENGLPFNGTAHYLRELNIHRGIKLAQTNVSVEYDFEETTSCIKMMCTFPMDSPATDCVAVVHQRISQLNSSGLINIMSYKFSSSDDSASGCIPRVDLLQYQIGVVGGKRLIPSSPDHLSSVCSTECIIGSVIGVIIIVVIIVMVIIILLSWRRMRKKKVKGANLNARPHGDGNGNDIPVQTRPPNSDAAGTQAAVDITRDPVTIPPTNKPSATVEDPQDDPTQQVLYVDQPVPFLGANKVGPTNGPPVALQSVNDVPGQTQSSTFTGATPVIQPNKADQANSRNAELSLSAPPIDKKDAINHKGGLNQESSSGSGSKIANHPTSTGRTAVTGVGMPSSSVQPEYVVRGSNAAVGGSNEKQDQMLSLNAAGKAEDPHSKPFKSKRSIHTLPDLPPCRISREHLGEDHDSSSPPVRSSLNNFNKIEWPRSEQESENEGGALNDR